MNRPEENPEVVYLCACINRLRYDYEDFREADTRRAGGVPQVNRPGNRTDRAFGKIRAGVRPMSREKFVDRLVDGLCADQRFKRRETFAVKWWATLKHEHPKAPALEDEATWTLVTLMRWKKIFWRDLPQRLSCD
jgi:hypothetical protein